MNISNYLDMAVLSSPMALMVAGLLTSNIALVLVSFAAVPASIIISDIINEA